MISQVLRTFATVLFSQDFSRSRFVICPSHIFLGSLESVFGGGLGKNKTFIIVKYLKVSSFYLRLKLYTFFFVQIS
jgi:hypothetical protein